MSEDKDSRIAKIDNLILEIEKALVMPLLWYAKDLKEVKVSVDKLADSLNRSLKGQ